MKKLFITLFLILAFAIPATADGPFCVDAVYDAGIAYFEIADRIFAGTDGTYANRLWEATIDGGDLSAVDGAVDGRALQIEAQEATASGTGTADTVGLYDVDTTTVLAYWPCTAVAMSSGGTYSFGTASQNVFRDITVSP